MSASSPKVPKVDENGFILCETGDFITNKYRYEKVLGEGAFGRVVLATKMMTNEKVALKIFKNDPDEFEYYEREVHAVGLISSKALHYKNLFVQMEEHFCFHGHACITYELLGQSLFDFMKETEFDKFSMDDIRHISYQLSHAVNFLHINSIVHTDIKPHNILFVNTESTHIKLIDLGTVAFCGEYQNHLITTVYYRAPEVILELNWSQPCDVWSIGCTLFQLYYGSVLFPTNDVHKLLATMEVVLGPMPWYMVDTSKTHFFEGGELIWNWKVTSESELDCAPLWMYMMDNSDDVANLFNLIEQMLNYDPQKRITLNEVLDSSFFEQIPPHQQILNIV